VGIHLKGDTAKNTDRAAHHNERDVNWGNNHGLRSKYAATTVVAAAIVLFLNLKLCGRKTTNAGKVHMRL